jgi:hypothetical protein
MALKWLIQMHYILHAGNKNKQLLQNLYDQVVIIIFLQAIDIHVSMLHSISLNITNSTTPSKIIGDNLL